MGAYVGCPEGFEYWSARAQKRFLDRGEVPEESIFRQKDRGEVPEGWNELYIQSMAENLQESDIPTDTILPQHLIKGTGSWDGGVDILTFDSFYRKWGFAKKPYYHKSGTTSIVPRQSVTIQKGKYRETYTVHYENKKIFFNFMSREEITIPPSINISDTSQPRSTFQSDPRGDRVGQRYRDH